MNFIGTCVHLDFETIDEIRDNSREVTWRTIKRNIDNDLLNSMIKNSGYQSESEFKNDFCVAFYKSKFKNKTCYVIVHSCIEHVFAEEEI